MTSANILDLLWALQWDRDRISRDFCLMNVVCTDYKSQYCVSICVWTTSSQLYSPRGPIMGGKRHQNTLPFEAAAVVAAGRFVVAEQCRMRQLHPLCLSLSQCHCCLHISSVSHSHTWYQWRETTSENCVCVWYVAHHSDEIIVMLMESTSDATSHGSWPITHTPHTFRPCIS